VGKKTNESMNQDSFSPIMDVLDKTLVEANEHMKLIAKQQATMAHHQVIMQAPEKMSDNYFKNCMSPLP